MYEPASFVLGQAAIASWVWGVLAVMVVGAVVVTVLAVTRGGGASSVEEKTEQFVKDIEQPPAAGPPSSPLAGAPEDEAPALDNLKL